MSPCASTKYPSRLTLLNASSLRIGLLLLPDRPHLDRTVVCARTFRRPRECRFAVGDVDQVIAAELFLRVGKRPVDDLGLALGHPHGRRLVAVGEPIGVFEDT